MEIFFTSLLFLLGAVLIVKGGDIFVDAAGWISDVTGISRAVIGATLVSLATTSPEYFVSLIATLKGANDLSVGNAVGSMTANLGIAFALLAIFTPGKVEDRLYGKKGAVMLVATALLTVFCLNGYISVAEGLCLLLVFVLFTWMTIHYGRKEEEKRVRKQTNAGDITLNTAKFIGGAAGILLGSRLIVDNGQILASAMGVSEAVIGLTFVAIGTSLPELVTSVAAIIKKESALSIGNILGANTLDATLILATGAFISGGNLYVSPETVRFDLPVSLLLMLVAVLPTAVGKKIYRWQGILIAVLYALYLACIALYRI